MEETLRVLGWVGASLLVVIGVALVRTARVSGVLDETLGARVWLP